ncbi:MAG TPA: cellulose synthase subunit BcsC-related outer membrane protein [Magnetospirillum sp.]|nr:cellulose synthase subunit BcsC-related outer membrane protein [Magnetospirillum sp.]
MSKFAGVWAGCAGVCLMASSTAMAEPLDPLAGRNDWNAGGGIELRTTNGVHGQGSLRILAERAFAEGMVADWRVNMTLVRANVATGMATPGTDLGKRFAAETSSPLPETDIVFPIVSVRHESDDWTTSAKLSSTPMGGPISPRPVGSVAATHYGSSTILDGRLFAEPVVASMLSYTGTRDPVTGQYWGRVVDQGAGAQATFLLGERTSLAFGGEGAYLQGQDVADNYRVNGRVDAAYDFRPDGFDHLRVGPFVSYSHFDRNLSHYTYGHGGYYSPDSDVREGLLVDALTAEGRPWQVEMKTSLALGQVQEASSPRFPVGGGGGADYAASSSNGINSEISLRASALVSEQLILSGFGRYQAAPQYTDMAVGAFLTVPFSPRGGVFSADLPNSIFTPFR